MIDDCLKKDVSSFLIGIADQVKYSSDENFEAMLFGIIQCITNHFREIVVEGNPDLFNPSSN